MSIILHLNDVEHENGIVTIEAVVDEMICYRSSSFFEPEEWGPAICKAEYELSEDDIFPSTEKEQIQFLEDLDLNWEIVEDY